MELSELKPICGIYKITNKTNGRVYIGQSVSIIARWGQHVNDLCLGRHHCKPLLSDFQDMGLDVFYAEVAEECGIEELKSKESALVKTLHDAGVVLYNTGNAERILLKCHQ